jgi:hypothetical protein
MTREDFIDYLTANGCEIVRIANQGYHVIRNIESLSLSGVPITDPPLDATVCRICKTLGVKPPDVSAGPQELIDRIHEEFNGHAKNN